MIMLDTQQKTEDAHLVDPVKVLSMLRRRNIITTRPDEAARCCGLERDADGFCRNREYHPIYVGTF